MDPIAKNFPWYSPYQYAGNKPIACIDMDGLEDTYYSKSFKKTGNELILNVLSASGLKKEAEKQFAKNNNRYDLYIVVVPNPQGGVARDALDGDKPHDYGTMESTYILSKKSKQDFAKTYKVLKDQGMDPMKSIKAGKDIIVMEVTEEFAKTYETEGITNKDRELGMYSVKVGAFTIWHGFQHANKTVEGKNKDPYGRDDHREMYGKDYSAESYDWYGSSPSYNDVKDKNAPAGDAKEKIEEVVDKIDKPQKQ